MGNSVKYLSTYICDIEMRYNSSVSFPQMIVAEVTPQFGSDASNATKSEQSHVEKWREQINFELRDYLVNRLVYEDVMWLEVSPNKDDHVEMMELFHVFHCKWSRSFCVHRFAALLCVNPDDECGIETSLKSARKIERDIYEAATSKVRLLCSLLLYICLKSPFRNLLTCLYSMFEKNNILPILLFSRVNTII